ncbi:MAG: DUF433 domain-containing protein [Planctomycetes bacterium]|nr:DUF433 domain-containing protein [Planctomycetota bacterium]
MNWREHIVSVPEIAHGKPCVSGTRVLVSVVLAELAAGESWESVCRGYGITREDIAAVLAFASEMSRKEMVHLPEAG